MIRREAKFEGGPLDGKVLTLYIGQVSKPAPVYSTFLGGLEHEYKPKTAKGLEYLYLGPRKT